MANIGCAREVEGTFIVVGSIIQFESFRYLRPDSALPWLLPNIVSPDKTFADELRLCQGAMLTA